MRTLKQLTAALRDIEGDLLYHVHNGIAPAWHKSHLIEATEGVNTALSAVSQITES